MRVIACTSTDVLGYGCPCQQNDWEHEWCPAYPASERDPDLHWCANCDCCVADVVQIAETEEP